MTDLGRVDRFFKAIFIGFIPVPIGAFFILLFSTLIEATLFSLEDYFVVVFYGYVIGIIPSILFSVMMEFLVKPKARKNSTILAVASLFGFISGVIIGALASAVSDGDVTGEFFGTVLVGIIVGYIMGLLFRHPVPKVTSQSKDLVAEELIQLRKEVERLQTENEQLKSIVQGLS